VEKKKKEEEKRKREEEERRKREDEEERRKREEKEERRKREEEERKSFLSLSLSSSKFQQLSPLPLLPSPPPPQQKLLRPPSSLLSPEQHSLSKQQQVQIHQHSSTLNRNHSPSRLHFFSPSKNYNEYSYPLPRLSSSPCHSSLPSGSNKKSFPSRTPIFSILFSPDRIENDKKYIND
jgi:hypothetical protein